MTKHQFLFFVFLLQKNEYNVVMEGPENSAEIKVDQETAYPVRLRPAVFSFLAEGLRPEYKSELEAVQKDGSFKGLQEFHHSSRIGRLMGEMLDQFEDPEKIPDKPVLQLSKEDVSFLKDKISRPQDAGGSTLWREMMDEVSTSFSDARFKAKVDALFGKVKSKFRR